MDSGRHLHLWIALGSLAAGLSLPGCETLRDAGVPGMEQFIDQASRDREEEQHRSNYMIERDGDSLRWLLVHRVRSGMTREEVQGILGERGVREYNDRHLKGKSPRYLVADEMYKFGPDNTGHSYFLGFRDDTLVNFDPREIAER